MRRWFSRMIFLGAIAAWQLSAGTISGDTTGTTLAGAEYYWGVNFLPPTPAGVAAWNSLTFNFYAGSDAATATAAGTLYLLSSSYTGAPNALSTVNTASGLIASTSTVSGGVWDFGSSVTVTPGTQYWVFEDTALPETIRGLGTGPENVYYTSDPAVAFGSLAGSVNYNFSGSPVGDDDGSEDTPEPTTLLLMAPALLLVLRRSLTR